MVAPYIFEGTTASFAKVPSKETSNFNVCFDLSNLCPGAPPLNDVHLKKLGLIKVNDLSTPNQSMKLKSENVSPTISKKRTLDSMVKNNTSAKKRCEALNITSSSLTPEIKQIIQSLIEEKNQLIEQNQLLARKICQFQEIIKDKERLDRLLKNIGIKN